MTNFPIKQVEACFQAIEVFNKIAGNLDKPIDYNLEYNMLKEEVIEYLEASMNGNELIREKEQKDAAADIFVILWGTILKHGWKETFFNSLQEVCKSNLSKFPSTADEVKDTIEKYSKEGVNTFSEFNDQYQVYVIKREDGKIMKSINWTPPQI